MFCTRCGAAMQDGQAYCGCCGKPERAGAAPAPFCGRVTRHVHLLGILWIAYSALWLLAGSVGLFGARMLRIVWHDRWWDHGHIPWQVEQFVPNVISFFGTSLVIFGVLGIVAGWGLLDRRLWARGLTLVVGFIALLSPPFGTALGIFTLWVLLPAHAGAEYNRIAG